MSNDDGVTVLPDGSAFAVGTLPLPNDHWIYEKDAEGYTPPPPMPLRVGTEHPARAKLVEAVQQAAQYAVRAATMCGKTADFDPDALVQAMVVGLLGYHTKDGLGSEPWQNPPNTEADLDLVFKLLGVR